MKKNYMKPEVNEIEVAANQAIAKCGRYVVGYENSWTRGNGEGRGKYGYRTPQLAWDAYDHHDWYNMTSVPGGVPGKAEFQQQNTNGPYIYNVMYVENMADGVKTGGTFNDLNNNGVMDAGEYISWQEGNWNQALIDVATGAAGAVVAS